MATLNLFPSRIRFVDQDGMLTPEAVRALSTLTARVGGSFGDQGLDSFGLQFASGGEGEILNTTYQRQESVSLLEQLFAIEEYRAQAEMVFAEASEPVPGAIVAVTPTGSPFAYVATAPGTLSVAGGTVSNISITRGATTVSLGLLAGLVPVSAGDTITTTYAVAPTMAFIPR